MFAPGTISWPTFKLDNVSSFDHSHHGHLILKSDLDSICKSCDGFFSQCIALIFSIHLQRNLSFSSCNRLSLGKQATMLSQTGSYLIWKEIKDALYFVVLHMFFPCAHLGQFLQDGENGQQKKSVTVTKGSHQQKKSYLWMKIAQKVRITPKK